MTDLKSDLNQLVIFAKVVETRSFTAAGRALGLPKSTVSRKVAQLEERLGVVLLERTTRRLSLTDVGAAFYERCARISREIEEAERAVQGRRDPQGLLRLAASPQCASTCLFELISEFLLAHPQVDIELELSERAVDLLEEGLDLWIGFGQPADSRSSVRELGLMTHALLASPRYLQRRGLPERPDELDDHDLVVLGNPRRPAALELRNREGDLVSIAAQPRLVVNSVEMLREAVLAGVGIGLLPSFRCADELDSGALQRLLHEWTHAELALHAVYPTDRQLSAKLRSFLDHLSARLQAPAWLSSPELSSSHASARAQSVSPVSLSSPESVSASLSSPPDSPESVSASLSSWPDSPESVSVSESLSSLGSGE